MNKSFKVDKGCTSLWGIAWLLCMQNEGAWRMPGESKCSTRCDHMMWSLGMPYLEDRPCMGMVRKLWNILNRCVKVYSQMISLLFVFCQLVAMQVWWMMGCTVMLQWSQFTWFLQNWGITHAWLTLAMLAISRRQRIPLRECPINCLWVSGRLCSVLAGFMVMCRWENVLLTDSWIGAWKCFRLCAHHNHPATSTCHKFWEDPTCLMHSTPSLKIMWSSHAAMDSCQFIYSMPCNNPMSIGRTSWYI